jgi:hypothetical protein
MMRRAAPLLSALVLAVTAGCDGGGDESTTQPSPTTTARESARAALERGVRSALNENRRLSIYVLLNNEVPSWAGRSTRGPALAGLRSAASDRRKRGIRVRLLSDRFQIVSIRLDPSYTKATASPARVSGFGPTGRTAGPLAAPSS